MKLRDQGLSKVRSVYTNGHGGRFLTKMDTCKESPIIHSIPLLVISLTFDIVLHGRNRSIELFIMNDDDRGR
jgi:hypothetical protein